MERVWKDLLAVSDRRGIVQCPTEALLGFRLDEKVVHQCHKDRRHVGWRLVPWLAAATQTITEIGVVHCMSCVSLCQCVLNMC